jgi:acetyltransferase-like isoleucine patch superfamily enzyme
MSKKLRMVALLVIALLPFGKKLLYSWLFSAKIGKGVRLGFAALLLFDELEISDDCTIRGFSLIRASRIKLGVRCKIGSLSRITVHSLLLGPSVTIAQQVSILAEVGDPRCEFSAGAECWIFEYCYINPARPIRLGRNVGVGGGSYIFAHGLWLSALDGYPVTYGEVNIGDNVWLPWGCFVMPGVNIGDGAVIGARSVVTKDVPAGALAAGTPAKVLKEKVANELSNKQKIDTLLQVTRDFCDFKRITLGSEDRGDHIAIEFDGVPTISLVGDPGAPTVGHNSILRVGTDLLRDVDDSHQPYFSITSSQCSSRARLGAMHEEWLRYLRRIGMRYYPIDEVGVE